MKVFLILTPIFVLIGLWLLIYSRRRSRIVKAFCETNRFFYRFKDEGTLEQALNRSFALAAPLGRDFSRIRDIVEDDSIRLFRVTEALDLSSYGMPQNTHFGRIAVFLKQKRIVNCFFWQRIHRKLDTFFRKTHTKWNLTLFSPSLSK